MYSATRVRVDGSRKINKCQIASPRKAFVALRRLKLWGK